MGKDSDILIAVKNADSPLVRKLLYKHRKGGSKKASNKKTNINTPDNEGFTALHHTALLGDVEIIMAVIEMDADINSRDNRGMCPLHLAAWAGKDASVKCLLEKDGLCNVPSFSGDTPLHLAAQHGYAGVTRLLLNVNAESTLRNNNLETPLDLACQFGHSTVVKQLLTNEKVVATLKSIGGNFTHRSALHFAAKTGHADIVALLLQAGADINEMRDEGTPLHMAALYGKSDIVKILLRAGADIRATNKQGLTPLDVVNRFTAARASLEIKQMLREASGEKILYSKAVSDYSNQYDCTCLSFKAGDTIAVLEQSDTGKWKGYVVNNKEERVGYFPAMAVHIMNPRKLSMSASSIGSSSIDSGVPDRSASSTPEKLNNEGSTTPQPKPVGMIPIGSYDVMTLKKSKGSKEFKSQKQTASGTFPSRMNSFKHHPISEPRAIPTGAHSKGAGAPAASIHHVSPQKQRHASTPAYSSFQTGHRSLERSFSKESSSPKAGATHRSLSTPVGSPPSSIGSNSPSIRHRVESLSVSREVETAGTVQHDLTQMMKQAVAIQSHSPLLSHKHYAEVDFSGGSSLSHSPGATPKLPDPPTEYTEVFFAQDETEGYNTVMGGRHSKSKSNSSDSDSKPSLIKCYSMPSEKRKHKNRPNSNDAYVDMHHNPQNQKFTPLHTSEQKSRLHTSSSQGYEDMQLNISNNNNETHSTLMRTQTAPSWMRNSPARLEDAPPQIPKKLYSSSSSDYSQPQRTSHTSSTGDNSMDMSNSTGATHMQSTGHDRIGVHSIQENTSALTSTLSSPSVTPDTTLNEEDIEVYYPEGCLRLSMDDQELLNWLNDLKLGGYFNLFKTHGFDMISVRGITPEDLNVMSIVRAGHRKKFLTEIAKLCPNNQIPTQKPRDVGSWLGMLNLRQYEANFVEGGFDDIDFIKDLDRNDLDMIDIKKRGHQNKLIMAVQSMAEQEFLNVLDRAVEDSPVKRSISLRNHAGQPYQLERQEFDFPAPPSPPTMSQVEAISPRVDIQTDINAHHAMNGNVVMNGTAKPVPPVAPKPVSRTRSGSAGPPPKPKPKPSVKPVHVNGDVALNRGQVSMKPPTVQAGDDEEVVTSAKSRDFWKQKQKEDSESSLSSSPSPTNTIKRAGTIGIRPVIPPPSPKPQPDAVIEDPPAAPVVGPARGGSKKAPPPPPPKRSGSISRTSPAPHAMPTVVTAVQPPVFHPPPPMEHTPVSPISLQAPAPKQHPTVTEKTPPPSPVTVSINNADIEKDLKETDDIMDDITSMIADFDAALDDMF